MERQTYIPGTEPARDPGRIDEVETALDAWLAARDKHRDCADAVAIRHESLLSTMAEHGLSRYPYLDPHTGKKRLLVVARDPKAKTTNAPPEKRREREDDRPGREPERAEPEERAERVTHRKVSRASVDAEIATAAARIDPFGATRGLMDAAKKLAGEHGSVTLHVPGTEPVVLAQGKAARKGGKS